MIKQSKVFLFLGINLFFILFGFFWIYHCRFWNDENWYYHGALLFSKGMYPYIDFFYHRLPLHIELYGTLFKIFGASFLTGRIISLVFFILLINIQALVVYKLFSNIQSIILSYTSFLIPMGLYSFLTNTTYSLNALLRTLSLLVLLSSWQKHWKVFWFLLINFFLISNRYLVDYQTMFILGLVIILCIKFRKDFAILGAIFAATFIGLCYIFKYSIFFGDINIFFDTIRFNIDQSSVKIDNKNLSSIVRTFLNLRFEEFDSLYPYNILAFFSMGYLAFSWLKDKKNKENYEKKLSSEHTVAFSYVSIMILLSFSFYYQTIADYPPTKLYTFPFIMILCLALINKLMDQSGPRTPNVFILFFLLFLGAPLASTGEFLKTNYFQSDLAIIRKVGAKINSYTHNQRGVMLSFTPVLANETIINEPRLNMEMYAFKPSLDETFVETHHLANEKILKNNIEAKKYSIIVLEEGRFFAQKNMSKVIAPYIPTLMESITRNYELKEEISTGDFMKSLQLYLPKQ